MNRRTMKPERRWINPVTSRRPLPLLARAGMAWLILTLIGSGSAHAGWVDEVTADNPLHWYRFEETSGATTVDFGSAGVAGVYRNGVTLGRAGWAGRAARFDGLDDYVYVGQPAWSGPLLTGHAVEFIFQSEGDTVQGLLGTFSGSEGFALRANQGDGRLGYVEEDLEVGGTWNWSSVAVTPQSLAHVVVAFSTADVAVHVYVNGVLADTRSHSTTVLPRQVLGADWLADEAVVHPFRGLLDEVALYDHLLTAEDVSRHYEALLTEPVSLQAEPTLTGSIRLYWFAAPGRAFALESTPGLAGPTWTAITDGTTHSVEVSAASERAFFRLREVDP